MEAKIEYKIYEVDNSHLKERDSLRYDKEKRVCFIERDLKGWDCNSFSSFELAVKYLIDNEMTYSDYIVLPVIRVVD